MEPILDLAQWRLTHASFDWGRASRWTVMELDAPSTQGVRFKVTDSTYGLTRAWTHVIGAQDTERLGGK